LSQPRVACGELEAIQGSSRLILINAKGCILFPVLAVLLAVFPTPTGFYITALTYCIASAAWVLGLYPLDCFMHVKPLLTDKGKRATPFEVYGGASGSLKGWITAAVSLFLWHRFGFAAQFWHQLWIVIGIAAALSAVEAGVIWFLYKAKHS
jgi:hypothetical protein